MLLLYNLINTHLCNYYINTFPSQLQLIPVYVITI